MSGKSDVLLQDLNLGRKKVSSNVPATATDYALKPYGKTALNALKDAGYDVISVGKIFDIFDGEGLTESNKSKKLCSWNGADN